MAVRTDCRHYSTRSTPGGDLVQRCRVQANETAPFACPDGCVFFEPRPIADAGWARVVVDDPDGPVGPGGQP